MIFDLFRLWETFIKNPVEGINEHVASGDRQCGLRVTDDIRDGRAERRTGSVGFGPNKVHLYEIEN
jgi:hypothetical protein